MNDNKIRVVTTDPETRNTVTTQFDSFADLIEWAEKQVENEVPTKPEY